MPYINRITIMGHLGQDAEVKALPSGKTVSNLSVATTSKWKDKDGKQEERTEWHRVTIWGPRAEWTHDWKKGDLIHIEGRNETRKWTDRDGNARYTTEVVAEGLVHNFSKKTPDSRFNPRESETVAERDEGGRQVGYAEQELPLPAHVMAGDDGTDDDLPF